MNLWLNCFFRVFFFVFSVFCILNGSMFWAGEIRKQKQWERRKMQVIHLFCAREYRIGDKN